MCVRETCVCPCKLIEIFGMINPLQTTKCGRGIVSVRVALLLRFTEIKPCSFDLFRLYISFDTRHELISLPPLFRFVTTFYHFPLLSHSGPGLQLWRDFVVRAVLCSFTVRMSTVPACRRSSQAHEWKKRPDPTRADDIEKDDGNFDKVLYF